MEVTRENFEAVLSTLPKVFQNAQFIAFDTEFTGLKVEGANNLNYFDTLDDLYLKDRLKAETFMALQIGFVAFVYDDQTNKNSQSLRFLLPWAEATFLTSTSQEYSHLGYNFYVYPSSYSDINFTCQSKSIQFLIEHGFDFNKVFKDGIPYLRDDEVEKLLERLRDKFEKNYQESSTKMEVPVEHKTTIDNIISKIQDAVNSNNKISFTTERYNSFIRKLIYSSVESQFGSNVLLESNKDESMTVYIGFSTEEFKEKRKEKFLLQKQEILDAVGFSKVIKLLVESKKLLIGHNLLLDLLFIIRQFLAPLPASYSEFKELVQFLFPNIIDTKYMASAVIKNIKATSLAFLVEYFENSKSFPVINEHKDGVGYKLQDKKSHEASYDAYLTGLCFLTLVEHLGKTNGVSDIFKNLPESLILKPILNKLSTPRLCDIFYMNLGGPDNEPDRLGVYHLTFPAEWTKDDITDLFKNCGIINIAWINNTSAYIKVKKEYIGEVEKSLLGSNKNYKLLSHHEFKSMTCKSDLVQNSISDILECNLNNSKSSNSTPVKMSSNELGKKRRVEEDIGEVIERPQKKRCST